MDTIRHRVNLLDTWIDRVDMEEAGRRICAFIEAERPRQVVTANLDFLRLCTVDPFFREIVNTSSLVVADGMPLVWASSLLGDPLPERVTGVDLVVECARRAADNDYSLFLLGAAPGVAAEAGTVLRSQYPRLRIVGTHAPTSTEGEANRDTLERVRAARPDVLLVAFGAPRQDFWIRKHMRLLNVPVCIGVGGSFDMLSGRLSRAPDWMQQSGLERLHRFRLQPGRLGKRYFVHDLPFFVRLIAQCGLAPTVAP